VPVISYILLRGRCASCVTAIGLRTPAVEYPTRREKVGSGRWGQPTAGLGEVSSVIQQYIYERVAYDLGGPKPTRMIPVAKDSPLVFGHTVKPPRAPDIEPLHPLPERHSVMCFDDEMDVVVLYRVVHQAKAQTVSLFAKALS
jgi:hypothetical protein